MDVMNQDVPLCKMEQDSSEETVKEEASSLHKMSVDSSLDKLPDGSASSVTQMMDAMSLNPSNPSGNFHIEWDEYFMSIAYLVSLRSKDPSTQVGACIVNRRNRIVGQGYNGMPQGCCDDAFPWRKEGNPVDTKYYYVCHAEMNAIFNKNCADISDCTIFTILFPCNQCAKTIIQSGITEVVYMCDKNRGKPEAIAAMRMLKASKVRVRELRPSWAGLVIDFEKGLCEISQSLNIPKEPVMRDLTKKREGCIPWDDYFLAICILVSKRSKCPDEQLGACIVNGEKRIVGQGYNGMPQNSDDGAFPWRTDSQDVLENKFLYECHAELNAILNANLQVKGSKIYSITFPCNECAKAIIQSGVKEVIYTKDVPNEDTYVGAKRMFDAANVAYRQHTPKQKELHVDFSQIES